MKNIFYCILLSVLLHTISFSQEMSYREWKESVGIISEMLISEGMIDKSSDGIWHSNIKSEVELKALYDRYTLAYQNMHTHHTEDILLGSTYSMISGLGLGMLESHSFGYTYPDLDTGNWYKEWATMNTSGDQFFKFHHPNKVGRELNDVFDRLAYQDLERFYGKWYWSYLHHFIVKNTTSTIYRGWAKYGKPFYYFYVEFDLDWFIYRVFGVGE